MAQRHFYPDFFCHPILSETEYLNGSRLGIDTWYDTACAGKQSFVEKFIMGNFITTRGFTTALISLDNLPIAIILYSYDASNCVTIILDANNSI